MKIFVLACLLIVLTSYEANGQAQINMEYDLLGLTNFFGNQGVNLSFIVGKGTYVDFSNHTLTHLTELPICNKTSNVVTTVNFSAYCLTTGTLNYLNHILPSNGSLIQQYPYLGSNIGSLIASGDYIILPSNSTKYYSADVFNTKTGQFYCHVDSFELTYKLLDVEVSGDFMLVVEVNNTYPYASMLNYINCYTGDRLTYNYNFQINGIFTFNHTSFYGLATINMKTFGALVNPFFFDLTGQPVIGTGPNEILQMYKYNDSTLIGENPNTDAQNFNLFSFDSNLNFFKVAEFNYGLNQYFEINSFLEKDSSIFWQDGSVSFLYNLPSREISTIWSSMPPIVLGNGSVVNFTGEGMDISGTGYFIQSPNEPVYFNFEFYSTLAFSPDFSEVWMFYNPGFGEFQNDKVCTLTRLNIQNSSFDTYELPKCTCYTKSETPPYFSLFNVTIDENNSPTVTYICSDGAYTVLVSNLSGVYDISLGTYNPTVITTNFEAGILNAVTLDYQNSNYIIDQVNVSTSGIIKQVKVPMGQVPIVTSIQGGHFLLGQVQSNGTTFRIFDVNSYQVVSQIQSPRKFQESGVFDTEGIVLLGYDPQNITNFLGIAIAEFDGAYFVNPNGNATKIQLPNSLSEFISLQGTPDNNSFFVYGQDSTFDISHVAFYTVSA